jgi:molybdopterin molybdotransferase
MSPGTCARIMSGVPVPDGCDAVVPVGLDDARGGPGPGAAGTGAGHEHPSRGSDLRAGAPVLTAGTRLAPRHVAYSPRWAGMWCRSIPGFAWW